MARVTTHLWSERLHLHVQLSLHIFRGQAMPAPHLSQLRATRHPLRIVRPREATGGEHPTEGDAVRQRSAVEPFSSHHSPNSSYSPLAGQRKPSPWSHSLVSH